MSEEKNDLLIDIHYEGRKTRFRLPEVPPCKNYAHLELTGKTYESYPRQFEIRCTCGCGYLGMAFILREEEDMKFNRGHP
jgi:hypothetical protein